MIHNKLEFTPVDYAAKSVVKILTHKTDTNRIFHLNNPKTVSVSRCLRVLSRLGYNVDVLSEKDFINRIDELLKDKHTNTLLKIIIDDFDENTHINYNTEMIVNSNFTVRYLRKCFFRWPRITNKYLARFNNILRRIL